MRRWRRWSRRRDEQGEDASQFVLKTDLVEILRGREGSAVEFMHDVAHPECVAQQVAAMLNLAGGLVVLGVEDDGAVSGLTRSPAEAEEWVMNLCRQNLQPPIIPFWETLRWDDDKVVGIIRLTRDAPDKPYKALRGRAWITFLRVGSTSREASREEEARLYQSSGILRYELRPVPGARLADLDLRRLTEYFREIREQDAPALDDRDRWVQLLHDTEFMVESNGVRLPSIAAVLLFGQSPRKFLPQSGVTATAWEGTKKDYATRERASLRGPLTRRRLERPDYPEAAVREAIVNAVVHRDYSIAGTDIELNVFDDRLEIISPGRLPNTITVDRMRAGCRAARNEMLREVLGDYDYVDARGLGVPRKIVRCMREHNGTDPELVEEETRFIVRLLR